MKIVKHKLFFNKSKNPNGFKKQVIIRRNKGQTIIILMMLLLFISIAIIFGFTASIKNELKFARGLMLSKKSYYLAEAGVEDAIFRIKRGKQISLNENVSLDGSSAAVSITTSGDQKEINSVADVSGYIRKLKVKLSASVGAEFHYGVQVGEGGLIMEENSRIEGAGGTVGSVYSNGPITGGNGATITGDAIVAPTIEEDMSARSIVCNQDQTVGGTNPQIDFAQSFRASASKPLSKISLYIKKIGNPDDADIRITADNGGYPSNTSLSDGVLLNSLVGGAYGWIDVTFPSPANLNNNQNYWIVLDAKKDQNRYWIWCKDSNEGFGNGVAKYSEDWNNKPWTQTSGDLNFKTYLGAGAGPLNNMNVIGTAIADSIQNSKICGDAYYKTIDSNSLNFVNNPSAPICPSPLTPGNAYPNSPSPPVQNLPLSDANIQDFKTAAETGGVITGNCGDSGAPECVIGDNSALYLGPKKINGNLTLTKKQTLIVTGGPLYFTGYINLDSANGAKIKCDPSFNDKSCVIITDSWVHIKNNSIFEGSGQTGSYIMILSTLNGCNGGNEQPQCTHHNSAVDIHNNAAGAIFYVPHSLAHLHNGVNVTEVTAYKLQLENNAIVTYEQGLINSKFIAGPGGAWKIKEWKEIK